MYTRDGLMGRYVAVLQHFLPQKFPCLFGDPDSHLIHGFLDPR